MTLLSVLERVSEIGLRRAVGATRPHGALQFLVESTVIGLLGALIGLVAGTYPAWPASAIEPIAALRSA